MMFEFVKNIVSLNLHQDLICDDIQEINGKKLSFTLIYKNKSMISIEVLPNGICYLMLVEIESEKLVKSITLEFENREKLKSEIISFLKV